MHCKINSGNAVWNARTWEVPLYLQNKLQARVKPTQQQKTDGSRRKSGNRSVTHVDDTSETQLDPEKLLDYSVLYLQINYCIHEIR